MEKKPKFNNKQNPLIQTKDNKEIYFSRSVSVNGILMIREEDDFKVLIVKRSKKMDQPNKWCLPCGYLDWDESTYEAIIREVFEETSIYIPEHQGFIIDDNNKREFSTNSKPDHNGKQNVAFNYMFIFDFENTMPHKFQDYILLRDKNNDEVTEFKWIEVSELFRGGLDIDWAFPHDEVIKLAYYHYMNNE